MSGARQMAATGWDPTQATLALLSLRSSTPTPNPAENELDFKLI